MDGPIHRKVHGQEFFNYLDIGHEVTDHLLGYQYRIPLGKGHIEQELVGRPSLFTQGTKAGHTFFILPPEQENVALPRRRGRLKPSFYCITGLCKMDSDMRFLPVNDMEK